MVDNVFGMMNGVMALTYCYIKYIPNHRTQSRFYKKKKKHDTTRRYHLLQIKRIAHRLCLIKLLHKLVFSRLQYNT